MSRLHFGLVELGILRASLDALFVWIGHRLVHEEEI
jgi:hypothetical protein